MAELITSLTLLLVVIFYFLFLKLRELHKVNSIRNLVAWSVVRSRPNELLIYAHDLPLWSYISNAQIGFNLPHKYRITGDEEWGYAKEILEEYQKDLTQSYFKGHLKMIKSKYVVRNEDYFMLALYSFLSEHQCDYEFLGHGMHSDRFNTDSLTTYAQTDFATALHKMHYITYMYCRGNDILRDFVPEWNEKNLKEILDTKQIQISWA